MSQERTNPGQRGGADDFEAWLTEHPEADGDLADLRQLRELYQSVRPPEPDDAAWSARLTRIYDAVPALRPERKRSPRPWGALLGLAAAAALAAVLLARSWWSGVQVPPSQPAEEPYPVAEADDVTIVSMDARDVAGLVVGEPPVSGELVFAQPADIHVVKCAKCPKSGQVARLAQGEVPMFVTAVVRVDGPNDD